MDAIDLLKQDHASITSLFSRYERLGHDGDARRKQEVARDIIRELSLHAAIEEQVFYPAAKARKPPLTERLNEGLEEHRVAKWELAALQRMSPDDERFDARFAVLMETVRHHLREEEREVFVQVRRSFSREELDAMGDALALARRAAPTHPHPRMPDEPPGNTLWGPVMAILDRGRDFVALMTGRSTAWVQGTGRQVQAQGGQLFREGRGRAGQLWTEAQRSTLEAPARMFKVSSDALAQSRETTRAATERARESTRAATERARRMAQRTVRQVAEGAASATGGRLGGEAMRAPASQARAKRAATRRAAAGARGTVSVRAGAAAGRSARKATTGGKARTAAKSRGASPQARGRRKSPARR